MPKLSVIIPSYNHAAFIGQAVESVLAQSAADLELIVIDDGSSDNSLERLAQFADPRLTVFEQSNQGAHAAINRGLAQAKGDYLAILNSDDVYHPQRLARLTALLEAEPNLGLAGSYIEVIDQAGHRLGLKEGFRTLEPWPLAHPARTFRAGDDLRAALLTENYLATTSNFLFRRSWFEQIGPFRPLRYTHDWDFALRTAGIAELALHPEPLLSYRVHQSNTIRENQAAMIFEICWCLAVHLPQHLAAPWFEEQSLPQRLDQLLHSIYTFDLDRVLSVMLLQKLAERPEAALQLLQEDDSGRARYLEFITRQLAGAGSPNAPINDQTETSETGLGRLVSRFKARLGQL